MSCRSKIARLPRTLRDELNRRLDDGEEGGTLLVWLNASPAVQSLPVREHEGHTITKQNLSEWRKSGFLQWQAQQDILNHVQEMSADARELSDAADGLLTDHLAALLTARYARLMSGWDGEVTDDFRRKLRAMRTMSQDIVELRRGDHSAARLQIEQDRLKEAQDWSEAELVEAFERWARNPKVREWVCGSRTDPEERARKIRAIFGVQDPCPEPANDEPVKDSPS